jgi:hypothetical protein
MNSVTKYILSRSTKAVQISKRIDIDNDLLKVYFDVIKSDMLNINGEYILQKYFNSTKLPPNNKRASMIIKVNNGVYKGGKHISFTNVKQVHTWDYKDPESTIVFDDDAIYVWESFIRHGFKP